MDALYHARSSAHKWGGHFEEYLRFHEWFDESAGQINDKRHRMLRHHAYGIEQLVERFGRYFTNSIGKHVPLKQVGEQHVIEDLGYIPTFADWVRTIPREKWMDGKAGRYLVKKVEITL